MSCWYNISICFWILPNYFFKVVSIITSSCFISNHEVMKKLLNFIFITFVMTIVDKFQLLKLSSLPSACKNLFCTNLLILKNNNNVTHVFLWNAKADSNFPLRDPLIIFDQFINLSHIKLLVVSHKLPASFLIIWICSFGSSPLHFWPNYAHYLRQHCHLMSFNWRSPSAVKKTQLQCICWSMLMNTHCRLPLTINNLFQGNFPPIERTDINQQSF